MTFDQWISLRQDARTWTEDEIAVAELVWKEAIKMSDVRWKLCNDANKSRIADLEREIDWLSHENYNLKHMKGTT